MINLMTSTNRPNREAETNKDNPDYHGRFAKFCIGQINTGVHSRWVSNIKRNKSFYKGDQWIEEEDIEAFLKDETGNVRNRIKVAINIIRPFIEQYRGNAIRLGINAQAESISPLAKTRMNEALEKKMFITDILRDVDPKIAEPVRSRSEVGKSRMETMQMFNNSWIDIFAYKTTQFIRHLARVNKLQDKQLQAAENLAFSGMCAAIHEDHGGKLTTKIIDSERVFWDTKSREKDFSDASFLGYYSELDASEIFERFSELNPVERMNIESYIKEGSNFSNYMAQFGQQSIMNGVPVFNVYWKDYETQWWGYIKDQYGYDRLERINHTYPGEENPRYTDADLVAPPDTPRNRIQFKGSKKRKAVVDILRYAIITPAEAISTDKNKDTISDIVYEYGIFPYQSKRLTDPSNIKFPISISTWAYIDGEVISPMTDAIDPQRLINRTTSVAESQLNQSGGANVVIDESSIDDPEQVMADINAGKPITLNTKGKGVPNTVGNYDATPKIGTYNIFNLSSTLKQAVQDMTGVNEALRGESTGSEQLVGVTQMMLQRGSLMQEPFYYAITNLFLQCYDYYANEGKNMYVNLEREVAIATGDDGVEVFKFDPEMRNEDMRVFIKRENVDDVLYQQANAMLTMFLEMQLIDEKIFANLFNRATPTEVSAAMRKFSKEKAEVSRTQPERDQAAMQQQMQLEEQMNERDIANYQRKKMIDNSLKMNELKTKNEGAIDKEIIKRMAPPSGSPQIP